VKKFWLEDGSWMMEVLQLTAFLFFKRKDLFCRLYYLRSKELRQVADEACIKHSLHQINFIDYSLLLKFSIMINKPLRLIRNFTRFQHIVCHAESI
jgi:hypothetical protein